MLIRIRKSTHATYVHARARARTHTHRQAHKNIMKVKRVCDDIHLTLWQIKHCRYSSRPSDKILSHLNNFVFQTYFLTPNISFSVFQTATFKKHSFPKFQMHFLLTASNLRVQFTAVAIWLHNNATWWSTVNSRIGKESIGYLGVSCLPKGSEVNHEISVYTWLRFKSDIFPSTSLL